MISKSVGMMLNTTHPRRLYTPRVPREMSRPMPPVWRSRWKRSDSSCRCRNASRPEARIARWLTRSNTVSRNCPNSAPIRRSTPYSAISAIGTVSAAMRGSRWLTMSLNAIGTYTVAILAITSSAAAIVMRTGKPRMYGHSIASTRSVPLPVRTFPGTVAGDAPDVSDVVARACSLRGAAVACGVTAGLGLAASLGCCGLAMDESWGRGGRASSPIRETFAFPRQPFAMTFRTRFAPSPTGFLHIGGARTELYCWLEAHHRGGQFILRIEDTDRERSTDAAVQSILDGMHWLGLDPDEGPFYQTQRMERYREVAQQLHDAGKAYWACESKEELDAMRAAMKERGEKPRYDGRARDADLPYRNDPNRVLRFKNPQTGSVVFDDKIKGRVEWANAELDDFVMLRSDGFPTYNFAVVVDDLDMRITEVIRGDDHVNNTPRQINLYEALGAPVPTFAHLPMILGPDGQKLSKRHGAVGVMQYREDGYLPHALLNYLVRLGWSHGDQEIFSIAEMIDLFDIANVNHSAARFDFAKLGWLNQHYLKEGDPGELGKELAWHLERLGMDVSKGPDPAEVVVALRERVQTLKA